MDPRKRAVSRTTIIVAIVAIVILVGAGIYAISLTTSTTTNTSTSLTSTTSSSSTSTVSLSSNSSTTTVPSELVIDEPNNPDSMDPATSFSSNGVELTMNSNMPLIFYQKGSYTSLIPVLASSWNVSSD